MCSSLRIVFYTIFPSHLSSKSSNSSNITRPLCVLTFAFSFSKMVAIANQKLNAMCNVELMTVILAIVTLYRELFSFSSIRYFYPPSFAFFHPFHVHYFVLLSNENGYIVSETMQCAAYIEDANSLNGDEATQKLCAENG